MLGRRDGDCVTRERPPSCPRGPQRREGPAVGRARRRGAGTAFLAFGEGTAFLAGVSREEKSGEIGRRARRPLVRGVAITEREALAERGCSRGSDRANRHPWVRFGLPTDEARVPGRARASQAEIKARAGTRGMASFTVPKHSSAPFMPSGRCKLSGSGALLRLPGPAFCIALSSTGFWWPPTQTSSARCRRGRRFESGLAQKAWVKEPATSPKGVLCDVLDWWEAIVSQL